MNRGWPIGKPTRSKNKMGPKKFAAWVALMGARQARTAYGRVVQRPNAQAPRRFVGGPIYG